MNTPQTCEDRGYSCCEGPAADAPEGCIVHSQAPRSDDAPKSYKVGVKTPGDRDWSYNGMRFQTLAEASAYGANLAGRWFAVSDWEVHPSDDAPNTDGEGKLAVF